MQQRRRRPQSMPRAPQVGRQRPTPGQGPQGAVTPNRQVDSGRGNGVAQEELRALTEGQGEQVASLESFKKSNLYKGMVRLVEQEGWDPEFAAAWLGQAVVETGKDDLSKLDVVEQGSGRGRGMFQYTDDRRRPYDRARARALARGQDVNDINWQIDYALKQDNAGLRFDELREGLTNPDADYRFEPRWGTASGRSPSGERYSNRFSTANQLMAAYGRDKVAGYTRALTGEYTRPGTPHMDRRMDASKGILKQYREAVSQRTPQAA